MKINKIRIILWFILMLPLVTQAKITNLYKITSEDTENILELIDKDALVIIGIDNTITAPKSKMFLPDSPYRRLIDTLVTNSAQSSYYNKALSSWYLKRKLKFTEVGWPDFISKLVDKKANVLGIAELNNAIYSIFKEPELWKYNELQGLNILFTDKVNNQELFQIATLHNRQSVFYKGIIFTGPLTKAETVLNFLKVSNLMPTKIIFIDDRLDHIKQVARSLHGLNLSYHGIYYRPLNFNNLPVNDKVANFQQEMLLKKGEWLEDEEAEQLLNEEIK